MINIGIQVVRVSGFWSMVVVMVMIVLFMAAMTIVRHSGGVFLFKSAAKMDTCGRALTPH